jgi:hypothetical protein
MCWAAAGKPGSGEPAYQGVSCSADSYIRVAVWRMWERLVERFARHPGLWAATVKPFLQSRRRPALREQLADGVGQGWRGMTGILESVPEEEVSDRSARTLGLVQTALMTGVMVQSLSDPENAPTSSEVLEGLRAPAALAGPD